MPANSSSQEVDVMRIGRQVATAFISIIAAGATWTGTAARATGLGQDRTNQSTAQGRAESLERFSRKLKLGREGTVAVSNAFGDIVVTGGSGDEVTVDAVRRAGGDPAVALSDVIEVNGGPGRVDVRSSRMARGARVSVDYTIGVPAGASVELHALSGSIRVKGVRGSVRAESVSGDITTAATPQLEAVKSVSGNLDLSDVDSASDLVVGTVSGDLRIKGLKARDLEATTVSGDLTLTSAACDRFGAHSVSGDVTYEGTLGRRGRVDVNSHSGNVRLSLADLSGFELIASTFSGSIRSDLPLTTSPGGPAGPPPSRPQNGPPDMRGGHRDPGGRSTHATYGDGSTVLEIRTFSGDITIGKR
jgi:DUF4097 and DUF4098 domain-containing protein YvlB